MAAQRNTFPCGHRGKGTRCHICEQIERERREKEEKRCVRTMEKEARKVSLEGGPEGIEKMPAAVQDATLKIVRLLEAGTRWFTLGGKRLKGEGYNTIISVPLPSYYRLICREAGARLEIVEVMSHQDYSSKIAAGGWSHRHASLPAQPSLRRHHAK
ncbi:MAG: hypothetical protein QUS11_09025 [Candidatus Fermentibacter sp.]|nr:hypothetical protein [Candidatus Fermentibacter sp.]